MQTHDCAGETDRITKCSRRKRSAGEGAAVPAVAPRLSTGHESYEIEIICLNHRSRPVSRACIVDAREKRPHGMVLKASTREWRVGAESARCFRGSRVLRFKFIADPIVKWHRVNCR